MKKMIIIGAGITGLTAGITALKKGYETIIYEKNSWAGGCCTGWMKEGYYIDNCMHWLTGTNQHTKDFKLWKSIGAINEASNLYQSDYFYKSILEPYSITLYKDLEKTKNEMLALSKEDTDEINNFYNIILKLEKSMKKGNFFSTLYNKVKGYSDCYFKYHKMTLEEYASKFKHPLLRKLFTDYIPCEYSPLFLFCSYATFTSGNGKVYGNGSKEFSENILNKYLNLGGTIKYNSEITKINISNNKFNSIIINNEQIITGEYLIYTADPYYLYHNLLDKNMLNSKLSKTLEKKEKSLTMSSYHIAFLSNYKNIGFEETVVHEIKPIKVGERIITRLMLKNYNYLYKDKEKTVFQVFIPQTNRDYEFWNNLNNNDHLTYLNHKQILAKNIQEEIERIYPQLKGNIKILDTWTPLTYNNYYNSHNGSYMGYIFNKDTHLQIISPKLKHLKNILITSYWQKLTGGLPSALRCGKEIGNII